MRRIMLQSSVIGTTRTLTVATFSPADCDFRDITIAGAAAPVSGTRLGDCKGNSGITFNAGVTRYWNLAAGGNWSATGWSATSGGTPADNNFPLAQDTALFEATGLTSGSTVTINTAWNIGTINMSARTSNTMTLANASNSPVIYGNWINGTGTTLTGSGVLTFSGRGSQTITSAGKTFTQGFTINTPSGSVALQDNFVSSSNSTNALILAYGTFNANGYNVTFTGTATQLNYASTSNVRTLAVGSGTWTIPGENGGAWNAGTAPTNLTITGTGTVSLIGATAKTFAGGGLSYSGITLNQGGAGALTITGSNTFGNITNTYSATGATSILFTNGTTSTFTNWNASGTAGNVLTISSTVAATHTLSKASGIVSADYLSLTNSIATGGASWYAGANSTNVSGNTGWLFSAGPSVAALTGVLAAALLGTADPSVATELTGVAVSGLVGTVTFSALNTASLTGVSASGALGAVTYSVGLIGTQAQGLAGTMAVAPRSFAITGIQATGVLGITAPSLSLNSTGVSASGAVGTVVLGISPALFGVQSSGLVGTTSFAFSRALTGASAAGSLGAVIYSVALAGVPATASVGLMSVGTRFIALTGVQASGQTGDVTAVYWKLIDDSQTANWQNVGNTQTPAWNGVNTVQTPAWGNVVT